MTPDQLENDINSVLQVLLAVENFVGADKLVTYTTVLQAILDNATLLQVFSAWINVLQQQSSSSSSSSAVTQ